MQRKPGPAPQWGAAHGWWASQAESLKPASVAWAGAGPPPLGLEVACLPTRERPTPTSRPRERCRRAPRGRGGWAPGGVIVHLGSAGCRSRGHDSASQPGRCRGAPAPPGRASAPAGAPPGGGAEGGAAAQAADGLLDAETDLPQQVGRQGTLSHCPAPRTPSLRGEA